MSAAPKWTPGPWTVGRGGDNQLRIYTRRGRVLCQFFCTGVDGEDEPIKDGEANAPLIAAAPDMAEALEKALAFVADVPYAAKIEAVIDAALAKARGNVSR